MKNDEYYMNIAYKEALKAHKIKEIPVGAVIVDQLGNILGKGYNKKEKDNKTVSHAEINAITQANKKIQNWRLNGCTLYVTLEPCDMCKKVIEEARIKKVIYAANKIVVKNYNTTYEIINDEVLIKKSKELIDDSFINIRSKNG